MLDALVIAGVALVSFALGVAFGVHLQSWWQNRDDDERG